MTDKQTGIAIRFVQRYDIATDQTASREDTFTSEADAALFLAMRDHRDIPMAQKVKDAWDYVHEMMR